MARKKKPQVSSLHNSVRILRGGADYFKAIVEIADGARYSLHLQTYIFDEDETGTAVANALIRAAERKVLVYVLLDGFASQKLSPAFIARLKDAGINFHFFEPFLKSGSFYIGRRLHHKLIVADSQVCMVAGVNISNRYNDMGEQKAWLDWAIYAEGDVASGINDVCVEIWNRSVLRKKCVATAIPFPIKLPAEECDVIIRRNDWVYKKTEITKSYRDLFRSAQSEVTMMTSYFWPPQKLLKRMKAASRRGVKIKLVLTAKADVPMVKYAERYLYDWLFRNKIQIFEYQNNILHGKITVCDKKWFTAGSYNLNNISAFASVELNLDIKNDILAAQVDDKLQCIIKNECIEITRDDFVTKRSIFNRLGYYLSYRVIHMIFYLFTFYFIQKRATRKTSKTPKP